MWAVAHPSTGHEGRVEAGRERVEDAEPGHDRAGAGTDAASGGCRPGGEGRRRGPGGDRVPAGDGRAPAPGIADGADGHAVRIEADRCGAARPTDLPAEARAPSVRPSTVRCGVHTSTGAGRVERRGVDEGHGGGVHRGRGDRQRQPGSGA